MKQFCFILVILMVVSLPVFAGTPTNRAIGYDSTVPGISARILDESGFGIKVCCGMMMDFPAKKNTQTDFSLVLGGALVKNIWENDRANFNVFGGLLYIRDGTTIEDGDTITDIAFMAGFEPEIFLLENLSLSTHFGFQLYFEGDKRDSSGEQVDDTGRTIFSTFGDDAISIFQGLSFNWYF